MMDKSSLQSRSLHQEFLRFVIHVFSGCVVVSFIFTTVSGKVGDLHNCSLSGILSPAALNLTALEHLDVSFNNFTGLPIPTEMGLLKNLKYLNLSTAGFAGTVPWHLGNLKNLTGLDLSSPPSQLTSPDLSWLAKLTALTNLSLNGVDLSATSSSWGQSLLSNFSNCSSLKVLNLAKNNLEGQIPSKLGKLKKLQVLHINDNRLIGDVPSSLQNCKMLEILDLSGNRLSGKVPEWIGYLSKLRLLVLRSNNLEGEIPIQICYLQKLQILDLAMNHLSGLIPPYLSNLSTLRNNDFASSLPSKLLYASYYKEELYLMYKSRKWAYKYMLSIVTLLDLSANNLSGHVPDDMGDLKGLQSVNLSHNNLTGYIPYEFGEIANLQALDIACNKLSGRIPETLATLNTLGYLNLSNNNLSGRIPDRLRFEASSFWGNPELCGLQLQRNCSDRTSYAGEGEDKDGEQTVHWWESWKGGMGMGIAIGFGTVIGALALSRRLSRRYYKFVDDILNF